VNWSFVRREWGAVTFVLTVLLGIVIVPIALVTGNHAPPPANLPESVASPTVSATASPSPSPSPSAAASPSPSSR